MRKLETDELKYLQNKIKRCNNKEQLCKIQELIDEQLYKVANKL